MEKERESKLKALQLTMDKLEKTYGKGAVMKMGDVVSEDISSISSGSLDKPKFQSEPHPGFSHYKYF